MCRNKTQKPVKNTAARTVSPARSVLTIDAGSVRIKNLPAKKRHADSVIHPMKTNIFKKRSQINAPVEEVFKWHARPGAIERLSPPWDPLEVIHSSGGIHIGAEVTMKMKAGPIPYKWHARHIEYQKNNLFKDMQVKGPFSKWIHTHRFEPDENSRCILEDTIEYALPFHPISTTIMGGFVQKS